MFSLHDQRHRRISLLPRQGRFRGGDCTVGQRKLSITADTYTHVLINWRKADYAVLLAS